VRKVFLVLLLLLPTFLIILFSFLGVVYSNEHQVMVQQGVVDVSNTVDEHNILRLIGEFEFLTGESSQYRQVPDSWTSDEAGHIDGLGFGTYRFRIKLSPNQQWGIKIYPASTSWRLYINGKEVGASGIPSPNPDLAVPAYKYGIFPLPQEELVEIKIDVSNWEYRSGGLSRSPEIGNYATMLQVQNIRNSFYLGLAFSLIVIALLFLAGYAIFPKLLSFLFYSLLCLLLSIRALVFGDYLLTVLIPDFPFQVLIQLVYLTLYLTLPIIMLFLTYADENFPNKKLLRFLTLCYAPFLLALPFLPLKLLTRTIVPISILILFSAFILIVLSIHSAIQNRKPSSFFVLSGALTLLSALVNDYLHHYSVINSIYLLPLANLLTSLIFGAMILKQISAIFLAKEALTKELIVMNQKLTKQIELSNASKLEIHHQVRNNLQIASSIINLEYQNLIKPEKVKISIKAIQFRFIAMSLAQDKLFEKFEAPELDFVSYLKDFINLTKYNLSFGKLEFLITSNQESIFLSKSLCRDLNIILMEFIIYHLENLSNFKALKIDLFAEEEKLSMKLCFEATTPKTKISIRAQPSIDIMKNYVRKHEMVFEMNNKGLSIILGINLPRSVQ